MTTPAPPAIPPGPPAREPSSDLSVPPAGDRAWKLISDPLRWTRGTSARDAQGNAVSVYDPSACRWCAYGALIKVHGRDEAAEIALKLDRRLKDDHAKYGMARYTGYALAGWNDHVATHDMVLALLREADV